MPPWKNPNYAIVQSSKLNYEYNVNRWALLIFIKKKTTFNKCNLLLIN